jgi:hypothetical protein
VAGGLGLSLALWAAGAQGQEYSWRPVPPSGARSAPPAPATAVSLGRPVALDAAPDAPVSPVSFAQPNPEPRPSFRAQAADAPRPVTLGAPVTRQSVAPASYVQALPPPAYSNGPAYRVAQAPPGAPVTGEELYNTGAVSGAPGALGTPPPPGGGFFGPPVAPLWGVEALGCTSCDTRSLFESDHCFDNFASPVTNPFLFEDPRSLTELRPIFIYQHTPKSNWIFNGGDNEFFGVQARLAITERLSFVMNKLGGVWLHPKNGQGIVDDSSGFAELWMGPKYTFVRSETSGTVAAGGLQFQIPTGSKSVFQHTGELSLVPYLSLAQNFGRTSYGSFNFVGTTGYAFSVNNKRSDYYYLSAHVDFDVANAHKIYPFLEMNWFYYTHSGTSTNLGFEGRDLVNFGSQQSKGINSLSIAPGFRYKFTENIQAGLATEFGLSTNRDLMDFRLTVDMIFRY